MKRIAVLIGSAAPDSNSRAVARAIAAVAPASLELTTVEIGHLPLFERSLEGTVPAWDEFRAAIKTFDAVLIVTPEHNRSYPAVIKNALDIGSRPYGSSVWGGMPAAIVSQSVGGTGGFGANHHLRQPLMFLNMRVLAQPEAYLGHVSLESFGEDRKAQGGLAGVIEGFVAAFAAHVGA